MEIYYHKAATKKHDDNIRKMATELQDTQLLVNGDVVAIDDVLPQTILNRAFIQVIDLVKRIQCW